MSANLPPAVAILFLLSIFIFPALSQTPVCKKEVFAALRPVPKLKYPCREDFADYDEKILRFPERLSAISRLTKSLENFNYNNWWAASVKDLNLCEFRKKPGVFNKAEKENFREDNYVYQYFGNDQIRIISVADPCYQKGFSGSDLFLLYRKNDKVYASEIVDGFSSRADNAISVDFAMNGTEQIIEVSTTSGGLYPTITNFYFTIDKRTNRVVPKNLFLDDKKKLTNNITTWMLLGDSEDYGLPPNLEALQIIKKNRLSKSFDIFNDTYETTGSDNHQKFVRETLHWNGKYYQ